MRTSSYLVASAVCVLAANSPAFADQWSLTTEFQGSESTEIRIVEPEGYRVTALGRTETAPVVFSPPNGDDYVTLAVTAPNGATWEKKVEVRAYRQTVVRIRHVPERAPAPTAAPTASYVGILANTSHLCREAAARAAVRLEIVRDGTTVRTLELAARSRVDTSLPPSVYQIRGYRQRGSEFEYVNTTPLTVSKDGWVYDWSCP